MTTLAGPDAISPSQDDPVVRGLSEAIGGPLGRRARRRPHGPATIGLLLLMAVITLSLAWWQKEPCLTHPWAAEYQYTRACYSDVYALYGAEGLAAHQVPYAQTPVEYPVVIGGLMQVASLVAQRFPARDGYLVFFDASAVILAAAGLLVVYTTARLAGARRTWDAAMVACAPVLIMHAYTNWDLAAAGLAGAGMLAWARRRPWWAGVFFGLGAATKLYPLLLLVPLVILCARERKLAQVARTIAATVIAWVVIDVPVWVSHPANFGRFWSLNRSRAADWDTIWLILQHGHGPLLGAIGDWTTPVAHLNLAVAFMEVLVVGAVALLAWRAPVRPRLASLAFLIVAGFLLANKVDSPQYVLWILPLAVLARPRWGMFLVWQATEILLVITRFFSFVGVDKPGQGVPYSAFAFTVVVRDAALITLMVLVTREIWHPDKDVVRAGGVDDPAGGVLDTTDLPEPSDDAALVAGDDQREMDVATAPYSPI